MDALGYAASLVFDNGVPISAFFPLDVKLDDSVQPGRGTLIKDFGHLSEDLLH
jgi:hypothetical protein